jgi:hypothetical protein
MGGPFPIDFGTMSNPGRHGPDTGPRHINCYVEPIAEGQPSKGTYVPSGLRLLSTVSDGGPCRGMVPLGDVFYAISGTKLVKIDRTGAVTDIGAIPGGTSVFMARNAKRSTPQIAIVVEGLKYSLESDILTEISDTDLPPPESVAFLDQRVIYSLPDGRIFYSDIDDVTAIDALSFATAEGAPDGLTRVFAHRLDAWLFGGETTEIWGATASDSNPFQRRPGGFISKGCISHHSVAALGGTIFWVGHDGIPYKASSYSEVPLAHFPVCRAIEDEDDKAGIIGFTYYDRGHAFYVLSGTDWTWQYNMTTDRWFERRSFGRTRWLAQHCTRYADQTVFGDAYSAKFYVVDPTYHDENGDDLICTMESAPMHARPNRICVDRFHANFKTGVGLNSTDTHESAPKVGLQYSDDGGQSWSRERLASLGAQGQHQTRVVFDGLGATGRNGRIWRLSSSAPVARAFLGAEVEGDRIGT